MTRLCPAAKKDAFSTIYLPRALGPHILCRKERRHTITKVRRVRSSGYLPYLVVLELVEQFYQVLLDDLPKVRNRAPEA